jgi:methylphosphotriester-DNA--protein-cysteine methyltransferase
MAFPKVEINWKILDALLQFKVTLEHCADYLNVSTDAIQRRCKEEKGMTFGEYHNLKLQRTATKLQQKAIEMALGGNTTMMIFALKNLANWSDKLETKIDTTKIQINIDNVDSGL